MRKSRSGGLLIAAAAVVTALLGTPAIAAGERTAEAAGCSGTNGTDVPIPDNNTVVHSAITITGCPGAASAASAVEVHIIHPYRGDLIVSLIAPDTTAYVLHNRDGGSADNLYQTYSRNLSGETANGTWRLRIRDVVSGDVGHLASWGIELATDSPGCGGATGTDVPIPDPGRAESTIAVAGCSGNAAADSAVEVDIVHPSRGDLIVTLVAPDGTRYVLSNRSGGATDNIDQSFAVDLSSEVRNGKWRLQVQDATAPDAGLIDGWALYL